MRTRWKGNHQRGGDGRWRAGEVNKEQRGQSSKNIRKCPPSPPSLRPWLRLPQACPSCPSWGSNTLRGSNPAFNLPCCRQQESLSYKNQSQHLPSKLLQQRPTLQVTTTTMLAPPLGDTSEHLIACSPDVGTQLEPWQTPLTGSLQPSLFLLSSAWVHHLKGMSSSSDISCAFQAEGRDPKHHHQCALHLG